MVALELDNIDNLIEEKTLKIENLDISLIKNIDKQLLPNGEIEITLEINGKIITIYEKGILENKDENHLYYIEEGYKISLDKKSVLGKYIKAAYLQESQDSHRFINTHLRNSVFIGKHKIENDTISKIDSILDLQLTGN